MRVNFDAPVLAAAFAGRGICADLVALTLRHHQVVMSESLIEDLSAFLLGTLQVPEGTISDILELLAQSAEGEPEGDEVIVTVDEDLLEMGDYEGIPILSPRDFWAHLSAA